MTFQQGINFRKKEVVDRCDLQNLMKLILELLFFANNV